MRKIDQQCSKDQSTEKSTNRAFKRQSNGKHQPVQRFNVLPIRKTGALKQLSKNQLIERLKDQMMEKTDK